LLEDREADTYDQRGPDGRLEQIGEPAFLLGVR